MIFKYCPDCGKALDQKMIGDEGMIPYCHSCDKPYFDNPAICVVTTVINEKKQILLLKSNYISTTKWTLVAGYVKNGETLEDAVIRETIEETGQNIEHLEYIRSYYFASGELILCGFIAWVTQRDFIHSNEVDDLFWCDINMVDYYINRENNLSGTHFDVCRDFIRNK